VDQFEEKIAAATQVRNPAGAGEKMADVLI